MSDFTSRFNELSARHPGSDTDLGNALGVSKQTISAWKAGKRFPKQPVVRTIAEFFGVGIPWLMGITDDEGACMGSPSTPADPQEAELVAIYRGLNEKGQDMLINTARSYASNSELKKDGGSSAETA